MAQLILHCCAIADAPGGQARVSFKMLQPDVIPTAPADPQVRRDPRTPYPGYSVIGGLDVLIPSADAAAYTRGAQFTLTPITK